MAMPQFMRDMSVAESVVVEAAVYCDAGRAPWVDAKPASATDAEDADVRATNDAHVSSAEAADMTAAKATTTREGGAPSAGHSNHRGYDDCGNFSMHCSFHDHLLFLFSSKPAEQIALMEH